MSTSHANILSLLVEEREIFDFDDHEWEKSASSYFLELAEIEYSN